MTGKDTLLKGLSALLRYVLSFSDFNPFIDKDKNCVMVESMQFYNLKHYLYKAGYPTRDKNIQVLIHKIR